MSDQAQDQTITCRDCRVDFVFTAGEATYYADNALHPPKRCKECRAKKKAMAQNDNNTAAPQAPGEPQQPHQSRRKGGRRDHDDRY